ncbi:MAG: tripartite tricarboxylate transporter substrate binding protein [Chloroflexota bacterium]
MKRRLVTLATVVAVAGLVVVGCSQAAPAPAPTTKASEPGKAAAPTAAPKKADWPQKGKAITLIMPWGAGGGSDVGARLLTPLMEKELGTSIEVVNKTGGGSQVGITELAKAKPDGYTFGMTNLPATPAIYLDADRKAPFGRKDLQPVAVHVFDPIAIAVAKDSKYKTMKDLMDAAKANPGKVTISTSGILSATHIAFLSLQKNTSTQFSFVPFDNNGQMRSALLGGHVDAEGGTVGDLVPGVKSGDIRILGVFDKTESKFLPGVQTAISQGYTIEAGTVRAFSVPAGTPKEVVDVLAASIQKGMQDAEHKKKMEEQGLDLRYMDAAQLSTYWDQVDATLKPIIEETKKK